MHESINNGSVSVSALDEVLSTRFHGTAVAERRPGSPPRGPAARKTARPSPRKEAQPEYEPIGGVWLRRLCTAACLLFSICCFVYGSPLRGNLASLWGSHTPKAAAASFASSTATDTTTNAERILDPSQDGEIVSIGGKSYRAVRKNIEDVRPGDTVLAQDPGTGELTAKPVSQAFRRVTDHLRILEITGADGASQTIETTDEHPFWVNVHGWVKASQLAAGDTLRQSDGQFATVTSSRRDEHPEGVPVYNFEVQDLHNYFVARSSDATPVLAHNAECGEFVRITLRRLGSAGSPHERQFARTLLERRSNFHVYRSPQRAYAGDFVVIDQSNPRSLVGWFVELKTKTGEPSAGVQLKNAAEAASQFGLSQWRTATGNIDELMEMLSIGRSAW